MQYNNVELSVRIKDRPITEYPHNGQVFIEGRDGSNFNIEVKNTNAFSVEAIVSVDGLSVIDGKDAGPGSAGYMLRAGEQIIIPGWTLSNSQVAAFQFAGKSGSYAAHATGSIRNTGVIGLIAYREKPSATQRGDTTWSYTSALRSLINKQVTTSIFDDGHQTVLSGSPHSVSITSTSHALAVPVEQELGTAFGRAQDFSTQTVEFERGDMISMIVMRYDSARNLKAMGIDMSRRATRQETQAPNAFPGMSGCTPPPGWRG